MQFSVGAPITIIAPMRRSVCGEKATCNAPRQKAHGSGVQRFGYDDETHLVVAVPWAMLLIA